MTEDRLIARPDIVSAWVAGWALSRGLAPPTPAYGGLRVQVGLPDQKARYVFADASVGVQQASTEIQEPHVFLKVCAPPDGVAPLLAAGWRLRPASFMMTLDDLSSPGCEVPTGYVMALDRTAAGFVATVRTEHDELAASGRLAFSGSTAVFDQIETDPGHRRRGLGRAVMSALTARAQQGRARFGALVATPDGRALYGSIGWRLHAFYTTAFRD